MEHSHKRYKKKISRDSNMSYYLKCGCRVLQYIKKCFPLQLNNIYFVFAQRNQVQNTNVADSIKAEKEQVNIPMQKT